jgi:hypothetical protein
VNEAGANFMALEKFSTLPPNPFTHLRCRSSSSFPHSNHFLFLYSHSPHLQTSSFLHSISSRQQAPVHARVSTTVQPRLAAWSPGFGLSSFSHVVRYSGDFGAFFSWGELGSIRTSEFCTTLTDRSGGQLKCCAQNSILNNSLKDFYSFRTQFD